MAKIKIDPEKLKQTDLPDGIYPAVIEQAEVGNWAEKDKLRVGFRIDGAKDNQWNGRMESAFMNLTPGEGGEYLRFCRNLGVNPADLDTDSILKRPVLIRTKQRAGKDKEGEPRIYVNIVEVKKR